MDYYICPFGIKFKTGKWDEKIIERKTVLEHVGSYYLFFDDLKMPNKQITPEEFVFFQEGDLYRIPLGKHSNIVLDEYMNFDLL